LSAGNEHSEDANRVLIHDFRNLLAVIVNYCELIAEETGDAEAVKADIQEIRIAAERAIALTDKLRRQPAPPADPEAAP
jgi:signal transduction histidine kinase